MHNTKVHKEKKGKYKKKKDLRHSNTRQTIKLKRNHLLFFHICTFNIIHSLIVHNNMAHIAVEHVVVASSDIVDDALPVAAAIIFVVAAHNIVAWQSDDDMHPFSPFLTLHSTFPPFEQSDLSATESSDFAIARYPLLQLHYPRQ